jgi:hypothetical protein
MSLSARLYTWESTRSQIPLCIGIQTSIRALYIQSLVTYPYADTSKSNDIAIYPALELARVLATTSLLIKGGGIS